MPAAPSDGRGGGSSNETEVYRACTKDGAVTSHGATHTSNNERCRCDNGVWGHCMELPSKESSHASEGATDSAGHRNFNDGDGGFGGAGASDGLVLHGEWYASAIDGRTCMCMDMAPRATPSCAIGGDENGWPPKDRPALLLNDCAMDGTFTKHGRRYTSPSDGVTCTCDDGTWTSCTSEPMTQRDGCRKDAALTPHGGRYTSATDGITCRCQDGVWVDCRNGAVGSPSVAPPKSPSEKKQSCRRDRIDFEHGASYTSPASGNRCKCQDGAWVDCKPIDSRPNGAPPSSPPSRPGGFPPSFPQSKNPCRRDGIETDHGKSYSSPVSGNRCKCQDGAWVDCRPLSSPSPSSPPGSSRNPPPNRTKPCLKDRTAWTRHGETYESPSDNTRCKCQDGAWVECQPVSSSVREAQSSPPPPPKSPPPSGKGKRSCKMDNVETDHGSSYESPIDGKRCRCQDATWVDCRSSSSAPGDGGPGPSSSSPRRQQCITPSGDIVKDGAMYDPSPGGDDSKRCRCWHGALHCGQDMLALQQTIKDSSSSSSSDGKGTHPTARPPARTQSPPPKGKPSQSPIPWPPPTSRASPSSPPSGSTRQSSPPGRSRPTGSSPEEQIPMFLDPPTGSGKAEAYCLKDGVATMDGQYYASKVDGRRCLCENGSFVSCDDPPPGWMPGMQWLPAISAWVLPSSEGAGSAQGAADDDNSNAASSGGPTPPGWPVYHGRARSNGWPSPDGGGSSAAAVPPSAGWNTNNK